MPKDRQLSTYIVDGLDEANIWTIGHEILAKSPQPRLYGRAEITVGKVISVGLTPLRNDDPPRHVNVVGWPAHTNPDDEKAAHKLKALELAADSVFHPVPNPTI